ncbi:hypothetical protein B0H10DRAFT_304585 [Mycena sp. CBHHK59/15]|nr:hypothetical protein B0H10DRAFT_304585 [Mycena sp. CBHHK59/15]
MLFLIALLPILSSVAAQSGPRLNGVARQTQDSGCEDECNALTSAVSGQTGAAAICTQDVVNDYGSCYSCLVKDGSMTQQAAQQTVDGFVLGCKTGGHALTDITISADGSSSAGSGSGSPAASAAKSGSGSAATSAAGPAPSSAGSSSGGSAKTGSGVRLSAAGLTGATVVFVVLSLTAW